MLHPNWGFRYICNDTQNPLKYEDIKKGFKYGGEQVVFTKAEVDQMKHFDDPGLVLMGFKPEDRLKRQYNVKDGSIIYPDENVSLLQPPDVGGLAGGGEGTCILLGGESPLSIYRADFGSTFP